MEILPSLDDQNFCELLRRTEREAITWEEFLTLPMPHDTSPVQTWAALRALRRCSGVDLAHTDLEGNPYWYQRTYQLTDGMHVAASACGAHSHIYRRIKNASAGGHFLMRMRVAETVGAARLDGLRIPESVAIELLRSGQVPQDDTQCFVRNVFHADDWLDSIVNEPFSVELLIHLGDLLLENVDVEALETQRPSRGVISYNVDDEKARQFSHKELQYICSYANHEIVEEWDHPLLRSLLIQDAMRSFRPLGVVSAQVGRLAAHLYAMKHDLPVLGLLPLSKARIDWEEGRVAPPEVLCNLAQRDALLEHSPGDLTATATIVVQLTLLAINDALEYMESWERRDTEMREILRRDPELNHRQRGIIGDALRSDAAEFRIRHHQTSHNVAYSTARRDLLELVDKGYLKMETRGKAFVFVPSEKLEETVREA
jgi:hypothetical protein